MPTEFTTGESRGWRSPWVGRWHRVALGGVLVGVCLALSLRLGGTPSSPTLLRVESMVWMAFSVSAMVGIGRHLPLQNAVAVALISLLGTWGMGALESLPGMTIPHRVSAASFGGATTGTVTGGMLAVGALLIPSTRGTARWLVRGGPRKTPIGLALWAATLVLTSLLGGLIECSAVRVGWWQWEHGNSPQRPTEIPWIGWIDWMALAAFLYIPTTPWLLDKRPVRREVDLHPPILLACLVGWIVATLLLQASRSNGLPTP